MKNVFLCFALLMAGTVLGQKLRGIDKSPMDMAYYPDDYAHDRKFAPEKIKDDKVYLRLLYSRPAKKDREVFGKMVAYDKVWRLGANEEPELLVYETVSVMGNKLKKGRYTMFAIPGEKEWTIIFNKDLDVFGHYSYNEKNDLFRVKVPVQSTDSVVENYSMQFLKANDKQANLVIAWDKTKVELFFDHK